MATTKKETNVTLSHEQFMQLLEAAKGSAQPVINTTASIRQHEEDATTAMKLSKSRAFAAFSKEPKVDVSVAVPYGNYCGGFVKVGVNGMTVEIPADGKSYKMPLTLAKAVKQRLSNYDAMTTEEGFQLNSPNASQEFRKGGLQSAGIHENYMGTKVADVSHG